MKRRDIRYARLLLSMAATLLALLLCELIIRVANLAPEVIAVSVSDDQLVYRRSANPYLSYELKPNYNNPSADLKFDHPKTNSHGQRDFERVFAKPPGTKRIVILGDSVVVGFGIRHIDDLMSRQLELLYTDQDVEVLNMAVSGYCTRAEVELLKVKGLRYDPDLVVLVFVENDFFNFNREATSIDGLASRPELANILFKSSHAFRLACLNLNLFGFGMEADPAFWNQRAIGDDNVRDGLALLRELAEKHQFETVVAIWPTFTNHSIIHSPMMWMPNSNKRELIITRLAKMHGLTVWDLRPSFEADWNSMSPRPNPRIHYTVGDGMHPSALGHQVAATILDHHIHSSELLSDDDALQSLATVPAGEDTLALKAARDLGKEKADYSGVQYNEGKDLLRQGKLDEALATFQTVLENSDQHDADAHVDIGYIWYLRGDATKALTHYRQALKLQPSNYQALVNLGIVLRQTDKVKECLKYFNQAVTVRPEKFEGHYNLATTLFALGKHADATTHLETAISIANSGSLDTESLAALGALLVKLRRYLDAESILRSGLGNDSDHARVNFLLGKALSRQNKLPEAERYLKRASELAPDNPNAWNSLGIVFIRNGKKTQAIRAFRRALEIEPNHELARGNLQRAQSLARP